MRFSTSESTGSYRAAHDSELIHSGSFFHGKLELETKDGRLRDSYPSPKVQGDLEYPKSWLDAIQPLILMEDL